jgi:predicted RNA-binding Zn ribbon-like protein
LDVAKIALIGGHPALDFINSIEGRGRGSELNYLPDYGSLAAWSARTGLISEASRRALARRSQQHPAGARKAWAKAMALREDLFAMTRAIADAKPPPRQATSDFNKLLAKAAALRQLAFAADGEARWIWKPESTSDFDLIIRELALSAASLLADLAHTHRIKVCANDPCDWMFLDTSRNGLRRWCRMADCGNVSKVRRFRKRQQ